MHHSNYKEQWGLTQLQLPGKNAKQADESVTAGALRFLKPQNFIFNFSRPAAHSWSQTIKTQL